MDRIKESFDSLPIAACFFDKNGVVRLINRRMLAIANWLRKGGIQSLEEMQSALHSPPANVRCLDRHLRIYRFPDGKALRFAQEQITTKAGVRYTQITAADVTELIRKQNQLKAENAKLAEANERLRRLFVQMPEIIREEETLAMKLRVHDDIGHSILAARRVLLQHTDLKEIRANAALWEQSISVLYRSNQLTAQSDPLEAAKKRAEELGVRVLLTGNERGAAAGLESALARGHGGAFARKGRFVEVEVARFGDEMDGAVRHRRVHATRVEAARSARVFVVGQAVDGNVDDAVVGVNGVSVGPVSNADEGVGRIALLEGVRKGFARQFQNHEGVRRAVGDRGHIQTAVAPKEPGKGAARVFPRRREPGDRGRDGAFG